MTSSSWSFFLLAILGFFNLLHSIVEANDCRFDSGQALYCALNGCNWAPNEYSSIWKNCSEHGPSVEDTAYLDRNGGYSFEVIFRGRLAQGQLSVGGIVLGTGKNDEAYMIQVRFIGTAVSTQLNNSMIREGGALIIDLQKDNFMRGRSLGIARRGRMTWMSGNIALAQGTLEVFEEGFLLSVTEAARSLNNKLLNRGTFTIGSTGIFHLLHAGVISNEDGGLLRLAGQSTFQGDGSITNHGVMQLELPKTEMVKMEVGVEGQGILILQSGILQTSAMLQCQRLEIQQDSKLVIFPQGNVSASEIINVGGIVLNGGSISLPTEFELEGISLVTGRLVLGGSSIRISRFYVPKEVTLALTSSPSIFSNESTAVIIDNDGTLVGGFHMLQSGSSMSQNGTLVLTTENGHMDIKGNAVFHSGSRTEVRVFNSKKPAVRIYGKVRVGGTLYITVDKEFAPDIGSSTAVIVGDEMEGSFDSVLLGSDMRWSNPSGCTSVTVKTTTTSVVLHCSASEAEQSFPHKQIGGPMILLLVATGIILTTLTVMVMASVWVKSQSKETFIKLNAWEEETSEMSEFLEHDSGQPTQQ